MLFKYKGGWKRKKIIFGIVNLKGIGNKIEQSQCLYGYIRGKNFILKRCKSHRGFFARTDLNK